MTAPMPDVLRLKATVAGLEADLAEAEGLAESLRFDLDEARANLRTLTGEDGLEALLGGLFTEDEPGITYEGGPVDPGLRHGPTPEQKAAIQASFDEHLRGELGYR